MRLLLLDVFRGAAVIAMVFYHFCWDLGYFGFIDLQQVTRGLGLLCAQIIGVSFITISGVSSRISGFSGNFKKKFIKRILLLLFLCASITTTTYFLDKNSVIFFGILHFLCICSLLSIFLNKIKKSHLIFLIFLASVIVNFISDSYDLPIFLSWIGFNKETPITNDFYPLFPWVSYYLLGFWLGKFVETNISKAQYKNPLLHLKTTYLFKSMVFFGQKSLIIYILHQPILFSLFFLFIGIFS